MLLIAAEYPFREIHGIEFGKELHECAEQNISRVRRHRLKCTRIHSILMDAVEYLFPPGNLVVYFNNPFGPDVMERVLQRLESAIANSSRDVRVVLVFPENAFVMEGRKQFTLDKHLRRYIIWRTTNTISMFR